MNTTSISHLVSISELQRDYVSLVASVKKLAVPFLLLRRNQPEAVLVSVPVYEDLVKKGILYEEIMAMKAIDEFEQDKKDKKLLHTKTPEDLFK